jgi:hypothetical protein
MRAYRLGAVALAITSLGIYQQAPAAEVCRATSQALPSTPVSAALGRECSYTASGNGDFDALVTGKWEILRKRGTNAPEKVAGTAGPDLGTFEALVGDRITVRILDGEGTVSVQEG